MRRDIKKEFIILLAISVMLNFSLPASGAEDLAGGVEEKKDEVEEKETEEVEENTMLNIMPYLKIPKRPSIKYSISQKFEFLDNWYLSKKDKEERFALISSPAVSIKYPRGRSYIEGGYAYAFRYYIGEGDQIHTHNANVKLYHRPTRRLSVGLSEEFTRNDRPDQEKDIDVKVAGKAFNRNNLRAQVKYEIDKRWRVGLAGNYSFLYFSETAPGALPERATFGGGGDIEYVIGRHTTLGVVYNFDDTLFEESGEKDSYKHTMHLRYSHKMQKAFTVNARGGCDFISYESGEDVIGASAGADLDFDISRLTKFGVGYDYSFEDSSKGDYLVYRNHGFQANLEHNLTPRCAVKITPSYNIWLYDSKYDISGSGTESDKKSDVMKLACGINYKLTKNIDIDVVYDTSAKFSNFSNDEYFCNHYLVTVRGSF